MGFFDRFKRSKELPNKAAQSPAEKTKDVVVGSSDETFNYMIATYSNSNITFTGDLKGYDYTSILRDKQNNMTALYQLSDYFVDADPVYKGIIKHVYVPYATGSKWQ